MRFILKDRSGSIFHLWMFVVLLLPALCSSQAIGTNEHTHYSIQASIDPVLGYIDATVDINYFPKEAVDTLRFLIHNDFSIEGIESSVTDGYSTKLWDPGMQVYIKEVTLPLVETAVANEPVILRWKYKGKLKNDHLKMGATVISPKWTELPMESVWIPIDASFRQRFTFDAYLGLPDEYNLVSTGVMEKTKSGWKVTSHIPGPDIPLIISNEMQTRRHREDEALKVSIYHSGASDSLVDYIEKHSGKILDHYQDLFVYYPLTEEELRIAVSPINLEIGSSYARPGFISLQHGVKPDAELFQLIAHEAAHLWWFNSENTQSRHNFLNESFAEYFSWLEVSRVYGVEWLNEKLISARKQAEEAPGFDAFIRENNHLLSYVKGPVLLRELHEKIGEERFTNFIRKLLKQQTGTVEDMLAVLQEITDRSTAEWFEEKLYVPGI